jgi:hypothetical protein
LKIKSGKKKITRIGFDFDGILVNKPPLMPKQILEFLFKGPGRDLHYRFPNLRAEQTIRQISHHYYFRPPIKKNLKLIKKIAGNKKHRLYLISSRYSFLKKQTHRWLKRNQVKNLFTEVFFNLEDEQPHLFKEKMIKKLKVDLYVDDDYLIVDYLTKKIPDVKIFCLSPKKSHSEASSRIIDSLERIFER